eukprot:880643-Prorocentrum_minimum.AAC.6
MENLLQACSKPANHQPPTPSTSPIHPMVCTKFRVEHFWNILRAPQAVTGRQLSLHKVTCDDHKTRTKREREHDEVGDET